MSSRNKAAPVLAFAAAALLVGRHRARDLLGARGRRPGAQPADLLPPRADRADRVRLLRLGRVEGAAPAVDPAKSRYDLESYTAVHMGTIFGRSPSSPARSGRRRRGASGGAGGSGSSCSSWSCFSSTRRTSCSATRCPTRPGRARISAVYALFGVVLIPISFLAIRLAENYHPPDVFTRDGPQMSDDMFLTFCVCLAGMCCSPRRCTANELAGKRLDARLRELREHSRAREKYLLAAYLVFLGGRARVRRDHLGRRSRGSNARWPSSPSWHGSAAVAELPRLARADRLRRGGRRLRRRPSPAGTGCTARDLGRAGRLARAHRAARPQAVRADGFPWAAPGRVRSTSSSGSRSACT